MLFGHPYRTPAHAVERFTCGMFTHGKHKGERKPQDILWCGQVKGFGAASQS
jgi:hypothetical protein